jgi:roadblock/LC7 domain-containing protein
MPNPPDAPNSKTPDGTADNGTSTQTTKDGNRTVSSGAGTYTFSPDGKLLKYETPKVGGLQQTQDFVKKTVTVDFQGQGGGAGIDQKGVYDMSGKLLKSGVGISSGGMSAGVDTDGNKNIKYDAGGGKVYKVSTADKPAAKDTLKNMQKDLNINKAKSAPFQNKVT